MDENKNISAMESIKNALKQGADAEKQLKTKSWQQQSKSDKKQVVEKQPKAKKTQKQPKQEKSKKQKEQTKVESVANKPAAAKNMQQDNKQKTQTKQKRAKAEAENQEQKVVTVKQNKNQKVKITFLGGVGEIGKNMTAIEYGDEMIIIDAGLSFPGDDMPGIDVVVPDITYLVENKDKVKAIILTHGHEDHIGGIPFLLSDVNVPIYGSRLTLGLVENKLREYPKLKYKLVAVKPKNVLKIGSFAIEFINVNHSIAGALALCISTPCGNIVHTGDFKIDFEPIGGETTDLNRFGELGKKV